MGTHQQPIGSLYLDPAGPDRTLREIVKHSLANGGPGDKPIRTAVARRQLRVKKPGRRWTFVSPSDWNGWLNSCRLEPAPGESDEEREARLERHAEGLHRVQHELGAA